ncbi:hypothetical protein [Lysobacter sp. FW306-1B-D06B]|uniref:hypothetical protein n=1 Tax=Lysobacter sp. FW306-1B-D06B TaxID=3140250 RepID=UPI003140A5F2
MRYASTLLALAVLATLSGCTGSDTVITPAANPANSSESEDADVPPERSPDRFAFSAVNDGIDICFRKIREKLGNEARVKEIDSFFSAGADVDPDDDEPKGTLTTCSVKYQNPEDQRKLLSLQMDVHAGTFGNPVPVKLQVMGDKESFKLDDYVIELGKVDTAPLQAFMDSQKTALDKVYSAYTWDDIRLTAPGAFSNKHQLAVRLTGRYKSNDLENTGDATLTMDGKTVLDNDLTK